MYNASYLPFAKRDYWRPWAASMKQARMEGWYVMKKVLLMVAFLLLMAFSASAETEFPTEIPLTLTELGDIPTMPVMPDFEFTVTDGFFEITAPECKGHNFYFGVSYLELNAGCLWDEKRQIYVSEKGGWPENFDPSKLMITYNHDRVSVTVNGDGAQESAYVYNDDQTSYAWFIGKNSLTYRRENYEIEYDLFMGEILTFLFYGPDFSISYNERGEITNIYEYGHNSNRGKDWKQHNGQWTDGEIVQEDPPFDITQYYAPYSRDWLVEAPPPQADWNDARFVWAEDLDYYVFQGRNVTAYYDPGGEMINYQVNYSEEATIYTITYGPYGNLISVRAATPIVPNVVEWDETLQEWMTLPLFASGDSDSKVYDGCEIVDLPAFDPNDFPLPPYVRERILILPPTTLDQLDLGFDPLSLAEQPVSVESIEVQDDHAIVVGEDITKVTLTCLQYDPFGWYWLKDIELTRQTDGSWASSQALPPETDRVECRVYNGALSSLYDGDEQLIETAQNGLVYDCADGVWSLSAYKGSEVTAEYGVDGVMSLYWYSNVDGKLSVTYSVDGTLLSCSCTQDFGSWYSMEDQEWIVTGNETNWMPVPTEAPEWLDTQDILRECPPLV